MGKINVLSFEIANLIAAGEVVERPSSVLKELIENSIDASATEIVAEIKRGGVALIRVTDNGCGIEKEDLPVSLKRHATSKIQDKSDLNSIMTLGFRGEALAAISSVSEVTIITKTRESDIGYMLTSEGGNILDMSEVGASDGTTVVVENLFFNVPARRKFLKKDSTEAQNVSALVEKVALSRPDISIQLLIDGEEKFKTPGDGNLINAIRSIYGRAFSEKMIKAEGIADGIKVSGYIGRSDNVRKNRNLENVFINGRYVKSLTAQAAIEKAYTSYIASECFPTCALFIEMAPEIVDVNVHPAKLEVKFSDERRVFEAVYYTVKNALEDSEYRPEMTLGKAREYNPLNAFVPIGQDTKGEQLTFPRASASGDFKPQARENSEIRSYERENYRFNDGGYSSSASRGPLDNSLRFSSSASDKSSRFNSESGEMSAKSSVELLQKYNKINSEKTEEAASPALDKDSLSANENNISSAEYKYVGEAFDCYVMIEYEGALLIIDKHAAHERIIFEDLKKSRINYGKIATQGLLLPVTVLLTSDEMAYAVEYKNEFSAVGFDFEENGTSVNITSIPTSVSPSDAEGLFLQMLDDMIKGAGTPENSESLREERALYIVACKAAIKGGRNYDKSIIDWLVARVLELPDITVCPHGRPIAYKLKKSELDRQFERIK